MADYTENKTVATLDANAATLTGADTFPTLPGGVGKLVYETFTRLRAAFGAGGALPLVGLPVVSFLAANGTNSTTTMATTGLSVPVTSGKKYIFELVLMFGQSIAADGIKVDFDFGGAAATNFRAGAMLTTGDADTLSVVGSAALATDIIAPTVGTTAGGLLVVRGSMEPSSTGNFGARYAKNTHTTGVVTIFRGCHLKVTEVP